MALLPTLTPVEEGAGAGAALGLVGALYLFKKPNVTEVALGALLGGAVGALVAKTAAAAQASSSTTLSVSTSSPGVTSSTSVTPPSTGTGDSNDAGGGGGDF